MSIKKSSVACHHGKGFNCTKCWPQKKRFRKHGREFAVLAEFPATEIGCEQANQFMMENDGTALLAVTQGRALLASVEDMGTPTEGSQKCPNEEAFQAVYKQVFDRLVERCWNYDSWTGMALRPYVTTTGRQSATAYLWRTGANEDTAYLRAEYVVDGEDLLSSVAVSIQLHGEVHQVVASVDQFVKDVDSNIAKFYKTLLPQ